MNEIELGGATNLSNTLWALILTYPTFLVPFCTWLLTGYFQSIPRELEESALIDGASRIQAMLRIVVLPEAVVNAVYHRSYEEREPIEVRISPDELVVLSFPGPDRSIALAE